MKRLAGALVTICIVTLAFADAWAATEGERTAESLKQLERDWADAEKADDSDKFGRIVADDWIGVDNDGRTITKQQLIAHIKSGKGKTESVELGPMDVKLLGDVGVVQDEHRRVAAELEVYALQPRRCRLGHFALCRHRP